MKRQEVKRYSLQIKIGMHELILFTLLELSCLGGTACSAAGAGKRADKLLQHSRERERDQLVLDYTPRLAQ